jgi:hypothetical protein
MENFHLLPNGNAWNLTAEGSQRPLGTYDHKDDGITAAARMLTECPGSLKIHSADGTVEEERTYPRSEDPQKTEG